MPSGASVAERAVGLQWLRPSAAAIRALTADPPDPSGVAADPAAAAHAFRYSRPTATPDAHPFTAGGLTQPALLGTLADLVERVPPPEPPHPDIARFVRAVQFVAGHLARVHGLDPTLAAAVAGLTSLGWLAAGAAGPQEINPDPAEQRHRWGLDAVAIGRRLAARWRLPEWVTSSVGLIRLHPDDVVRSGGPAGLFPLIQASVAAVEVESVPLGLSAAAAPEWHADLFAEAVEVVGRWADPPIQTAPELPDWGLVRLCRAVATSRRQSGAVWQCDADYRADQMVETLAKLRSDWQAELRDAKLRGLAEFAAGASHEINNPLAVVAGHAQMLLQKEADPGRRRQLAAILRQTERVYGLLRGTLQFARPPVARAGFVPLAELLAAVAREHLADCQDRQLTLDVGPADGLAAAGDPDQLRRALGEVVRNAVEAAPAGGVVRAWIEPDGDRVRVCVADSGPGPAPAVVPHLFDPFFSGRAAGRGPGLGLSIAWRLVRQNGGDLRYDPTPELPSRFTLSLPAAAALRRTA